MAGSRVVREELLVGGVGDPQAAEAERERRDLTVPEVDRVGHPVRRRVEPPDRVAGDAGEPDRSATVCNRARPAADRRRVDHLTRDAIDANESAGVRLGEPDRSRVCSHRGRSGGLGPSGDHG